MSILVKAATEEQQRKLTRQLIARLPSKIRFIEFGKNNAVWCLKSNDKMALETEEFRVAGHRDLDASDDLADSFASKLMREHIASQMPFEELELLVVLKAGTLAHVQDQYFSFTAIELCVMRDPSFATKQAV